MMFSSSGRTNSNATSEINEASESKEILPLSLNALPLGLRATLLQSRHTTIFLQILMNYRLVDTMFNPLLDEGLIGCAAKLTLQCGVKGELCCTTDQLTSS
jgi:hypothetical protein